MQLVRCIFISRCGDPGRVIVHVPGRGGRREPGPAHNGAEPQRRYSAGAAGHADDAVEEGGAAVHKAASAQDGPCAGGHVWVRAAGDEHCTREATEQRGRPGHADGAAGCRKSSAGGVTYEELGIEPVPVRAAKARMRAVLKWGSLRRRIAEMVSTSPRQRKGTWAESTRRWVRRYAERQRSRRLSARRSWLWERP